MQIMESLSELFRKAEVRINDQARETFIENQGVVFDKPPPCIDGILREGVYEIGTRNQLAYRLAAYFKSQGHTVSQCREILNQWVMNIHPSKTNTLLGNGSIDIKALISENGSIIKSVYANDSYGFSCAGILSVPGVQCDAECKKNLESVTTVSLSDASMSEYRGKRILVNVEVVGKRDVSYIIPSKIHAVCNGNRTQEKCANCIIGTCGGELDLIVKADNSHLLSYLEDKTNISGRIASMLNMTRRQCSSWTWSIEERNVEIVYVVPRITNQFDDTDKYTVQEVYVFSHGLDTNKGYKLSGYTHVHPKTNAVKFIFDEVSELSDSLSEFQITDEMIEDTKIFCPNPDETVYDKHADIINNLTINHIQLWGRDDMLRVVDLVFHSARRFYFQGQLVKGWMDILIIGDSGQAKTLAIRKFMHHYGAGYLARAESSTRAGLLYGVNTKENVPNYLIWGVLPRYSGRLVVIDEAKRIISETGAFSELTDARSSGEIVVDTIVSGKAKCETRLIVITNTLKRMPMSAYYYPVEAIADLIPDQEDIRRFDLAVGVKSNEVPIGVIHTDVNNLPKLEDIYSSTICKAHLYRVWNTRPEDITISHNVERYILDNSMELCNQYISKIQLVEPADMRLKLARISVAYAMRMNLSYDGKFFVDEQCVDASVKLIHELYDSSALDYRGYSYANADASHSDSEKSNLAATFYNMASAIDPGVMQVWKYIVVTPYIRSDTMSAAFGVKVSDINGLMTWLMACECIKKFKNFYVKTPAGNDFFRYFETNYKKTDSEPEDGDKF